MDKRISAVFALVLMLFCVSAVAVPLQAANYTKVGVKNGDWVSYSYSVSSPTIGSVSGSARIDITQVSGTQVAVSYQVTYSGHSATLTYTGDISTGSGNICSFVIAANLTAGDPLYIGAAITINQTISMNIASAQRTVNYVTLSVSGTSLSLYFDKVTGLLLKESLISSGTSITIEATSTSAFSADLSSLLIIGGIGVGVVALVLVIIVAYRLSRRKRQAETVTLEPVTLATPGTVKKEEDQKQSKTSSESVCPFCGAKVVAGATFCRNCGTKLIEG